jgi:hypothetical protein
MVYYITTQGYAIDTLPLRDIIFAPILPALSKKAPVLQQAAQLTAE